MFPSTLPQLNSFKLHLKSIDGFRKSENAAEAIVRDVSKFLYFCNSDEIQWKWLEERARLVE